MCIRDSVINNSYNARLDSFSDRIVRGRILASDGTVPAQTQMDGGGNETRVYPFGDIFDPVSYTHLMCIRDSSGIMWGRRRLNPP